MWVKIPGAARVVAVAVVTEGEMVVTVNEQ
jgi:hypothetical protein